MGLKIYTDKTCLQHDMGHGHPERPERLEKILEYLHNHETYKHLIERARPATREQICALHTEEYYDLIQNNIPREGLIAIDGDTFLSPGTWNASLLAAGAVCQAVDDVMKAVVQKAFCAVRPPGHHAEPSRAMGFCFFNNVAVGACHALKQYNLQRVAIVDFDVHHGNGTDTAARTHNGILFASTHEWPLFPGTGHPVDNIPGRIENQILRAGAEGDEFRTVYERNILPALHAFKPQLMMISAGFDAHERDEIADLQLVKDDFAWVTGELKAIAETYAEGRIVSVLEGGYDIQGLIEGVDAHLEAL